MADLLAKRGVSHTGTLGRFSSSPSLPLRPPEIGYNQLTWSSQTVQQQDEYKKSLLRQHTHLIPEIPLSAKKPWISDVTLSLIANFQAQPFEDLSQLKAARKAIKKSARRDKRLFIAQHLEKDFHGRNIHQWDQIRSIRSDFHPKAASVFNLRDKLVSTASRADTFADYLAAKVWSSEMDPDIPISNQHPQGPLEAPFTMHELTLALRRLKSSKAAGPDGIVGELYKHAPYILRMYLLDHYNQCLASATVPTDWLFSEVVMIVKHYSKDTRLLSNYRPISLTNISYIIFASMIQSRLSHRLDDRIRPTQFDFEKIDQQVSHITSFAGYWRYMKDNPPHFSCTVPGLVKSFRLRHFYGDPISYGIYGMFLPHGPSN